MRRIARSHRRALQVPTRRIWTPNNLIVAGFRLVRGWWSAVGAYTPDNASSDALDTWTENNLAIDDGGGAGYADPDGGTAARRITESSDGGATNHYIRANLTAAIGSWTETYIAIKAEAGGRDNYIIEPSDGPYVNVQQSTGTVTYQSGCTGELYDTIGDWRIWKVSYEGVLSARFGVRSQDQDGALADYTGDGRVCGYVYLPNPNYIQKRVSAVADLSMVTNPALQTLRGAHAAQGTDANQPLKYTGFASLSGQAPLYYEAGRTSYLEVTHADMLAVASGDDPGFAVYGVWGGSGTHAMPIAWRGAGTINDWPIYITGTDIYSPPIYVYSRRNDGSSNSNKLVTADASIFASPVAFAYIKKSDRTASLWVGGALINTITHDDLATAEMSNCYHGLNGATLPDKTTGDIVVCVDPSAIGTHAQIYAALREQGGLAAIAARWGVTA